MECRFKSQHFHLLSSNPFLTSFHTILNLDLNAPPLTRFPLPVSHRTTHKQYSTLLASFKKLMTFHHIRILATDRTSGLVIMTDTELQVIYATYLLMFQQVPSSWFYKVTTALRSSLHKYDPNSKAHVTDDRPPTFYFKIKSTNNYSPLSPLSIHLFLCLTPTQ